MLAIYCPEAHFILQPAYVNVLNRELLDQAVRKIRSRCLIEELRLRLVEQF